MCRAPFAFPSPAQEPRSSDSGVVSPKTPTEPMRGLPPVHSPMVNTWLKSHVQVHITQRSFQRSGRSTGTGYLQSNAGLFDTHSSRPPQAYNDLKGQLEDATRANYKVEQQLLALKKATR